MLHQLLEIVYLNEDSICPQLFMGLKPSNGVAGDHGHEICG